MARRLLGYSEHPFPIQPEAVAQSVVMTRGNDRLAIRADSEHLESLTGLAQYVAGDRPHFLCVTNRSEPRERQRFVLAHLLGHVVLGHVHPDKPRIQCASLNPGHAGDECDRANAFASELIMPERYVRYLAGRKPCIASLAAAFGVFPWAMRSRLVAIGLL